MIEARIGLGSWRTGVRVVYESDGILSSGYNVCSSVWRTRMVLLSWNHLVLRNHAYRLCNDEDVMIP